MCPQHQTERLDAIVCAGGKKNTMKTAAVLQWSVMRGIEWDMLMGPENSACESLCSVGISMFVHGTESHTQTQSLLHSESFSHILTKHSSCVSPIVSHKHIHVTASPSNASLTSTPACNVSPLSPPDTILQTSSLPAALNYSSNMPVWQKPAIVLVWQTLQARKICLSVSLCLTLSLPVIVFSSPLSPQLSSLFLSLIFSRKRHILLLYIGIRCHSDLLKWMWQAASLVHAFYKSHTFASIEFIHPDSSASFPCCVWPWGNAFPSLL